MADLISARSRTQAPSVAELPLPTANTVSSVTDLPIPATAGSADAALVELLFFAYRGFTAEPDAILSRLGFGRAHHRVMHFVTRTPGLRVADLLEILRITKQSLARVLRQLVVEGYIIQQPGTQDRRERLLYPTAKGRALADQLLRIQIERLNQALASAGPGADRVARDFLLGLVADADAPRALASSRQSQTAPTEGDA